MRLDLKVKRSLKQPHSSFDILRKLRKMPQRVLPYCEGILSYEFGLIGKDTEGNDKFKHQESFYQVPGESMSLMSLKAGENNKQMMKSNIT